MDVTQKNFDEFLDDFKANFPDAEFYSIDFEMTGIKMNESEYTSDLPYEKYIKCRSAANKYRIIQMGICLFIKKGDNKYEARPYNIYLFPREYGFVSPQISIDVSAAEFNTQHGMNWSKWFSEGITYLSERQIKRLKEDSKKAEVTYDDEDVKLEREDDIQKSKELTDNLNTWVASKSKEPFVITGENSFFRKHIYALLRKSFPDLVFETVKQGKSNDKDIMVFNLDELDRNLYQEKKIKEKEENWNQLLGFSRVIQWLIESKKPLVGHNCYLDILFLYSHFVDFLPYKFSQFKEKMNELFPEIYDTKFIIHNTHFKSKLSGASSLGILTELCLKKEDKDFSDVEIYLEEGFRAYDFQNNPDLSRCHEAGYDAFLTGHAFLKMFSVLGAEDRLRLKNSVNSMKCLYYLKLDSDDLMYQQQLVIYFVQQLPKTPKLNSSEVLAWFEDIQLNEFIRFLSITQGGFQGAMLILDPQNETHAEVFHQRMETLLAQGIPIVSYEKYSQMRLERYEKGEKEN